MTDVERVSQALKERFKRTVGESAGEPFEKTGVKMPSDEVWNDYARAAIEALR